MKATHNPNNPGDDYDTDSYPFLERFKNEDF